MTKKQDYQLLLAWVVVSAIFLWIYNLPLVISGLFFYVAPSVYLSLRAPKLVKKTTIASTVFFFIILLLGIILLGNKAWIDNTVFNYKLFNIVDIEYLAFSFFWAYLVIIFYEYFVENDSELEYTGKRLKKLVSLIALVAYSLLVYVNIFGDIPRFNYSYSIVCVLFLLIPLLLIIDKYPKLLKKFSLVAIFFIFHTLVYEILALNLGYWEFPQLQSQYVGWVNLFGVSFPVEELFFYITIGSISLLSYYEFFDDDRK